MTVSGHCNCGAIKVSVNDEAFKANPPIFCRCTNCRRQSGAVGTYVSVLPEDEVTITGDLKDYEDKTTDSGTALHRWFCGDCGCPVMSTTALSPGKKIIKLGLFESFSKPVAEIYCKNQHDWEVPFEGVARLAKGF